MADSSHVVVTSDRLQQETVANKMFPKVRSWFALGAPLELLSPLSVARIVVLVAIVTWLAGGAASIWAPIWFGLLTVACFGGIVALMRTRALGDRGILTVLLAHTGMLAAALALSDHSQRVFVFAPLLVVLAIFVGLFFRGFRLLGAMLLASVVVIGVTGATNDARAISDGVMVSLFMAGLAAMTSFTARTSRISGAIDADTGVPNIRGMTDRLGVRRESAETVVATVRLGGVSAVRDALGHGAGTELVRRAVEDLGQVLPSRAHIGRGAGDDVVVLIDDDEEVAQTMDELTSTTVQRISDAIGSGRYLVGAIEVTLSTHVGIAIAPPGEVDAGDILRQSALAARSAQDRGRLMDQWDGGSTTLTADDLELLAELRTAQERDELWVAYQPQVSPLDGRTLSVEALLRWSNPTHGFVSPGRFIPLAEQTGLVDRLTDWVVAEALDAQLRWRDAGFDITVSVNVSPLSLRSVDFGERVQSALEQRGLPPHVLMLEVTESVAFDIPEAVDRLGPLRELGVKISIDDFGTGYTSLAVLPHLPLDELKVDQQFVRDALVSSASESIVVSVCDLAHRLGLSAVAEGVEDGPLAERMAEIGFDLLQGYHFARPMPEAELVELLAEQNVPSQPLASASAPIAGTFSHDVSAVRSLS